MPKAMRYVHVCVYKLMLTHVREKCAHRVHYAIVHRNCIVYDTQRAHCLFSQQVTNGIRVLQSAMCKCSFLTFEMQGTMVCSLPAEHYDKS